MIHRPIAIVVEFSPASYNVSEGGGEVEVGVVKHGEAERPVAMEIVTTDRTATGNNINVIQSIKVCRIHHKRTCRPTLICETSNH